VKGIVAEVRGKYAVVLGMDGSFIKVRNNGQYGVGMEVDTNQSHRINIPALAKVSTIAAAFIFTMGVSYGAYCYSTPYSYVGVDINPSVELTANIYDRIIRVEALNEDGQRLLKSENLVNLKVGEGVAELLSTAHEQGYLKSGDENAVVLSVSSKNERKSEELEQSLKATASGKMDEESIKADVVVGKASKEEYDKASDMGLTPGKLSLIKQVIEAQPDLKLKDLKDDSVQNIMKQLKDSKQALKNKENAKGNIKENAKENSKESSKDKNGDQTGLKSKSQTKVDNKNGNSDNTQDSSAYKNGNSGVQKDSKAGKQYSKTDRQNKSSDKIIEGKK
jgi:hypothetical protein